MKRWIAFLVAVGLMVGVGSLSAGQQLVTETTLYGGSDTDSLEQASPWIAVRGASRVAIRLWSGKAAFHASTDADSTFSDSIAVFRVAFTDSITSTNPIIAGDSVIVTTGAAANLFIADSTAKLVAVVHPPLLEALRGPSNGSGIYTVIVPTYPVNAASQVLGDNNGVILPKYMRVYVTPHRRNTVTGGQSTEGKRVNGLKKLRGKAIIYHANK